LRLSSCACKPLAFWSSLFNHHRCFFRNLAVFLNSSRQPIPHLPLFHESHAFLTPPALKDPRRVWISLFPSSRTEIERQGALLDLIPFQAFSTAGELPILVVFLFLIFSFRMATWRSPLPSFQLRLGSDLSWGVLFPIGPTCTRPPFAFFNPHMYSSGPSPSSPQKGGSLLKTTLGSGLVFSF